MNGYVLDASAVLAWCFADETPPNAADIMDALIGEGAWAPAHWPLEVANILWVSERRKRITAEDLVAFLALLEDLSVSIDLETPQRAWREVFALAREQALTVYDAAYLELALRRQAPLVTKDKALIAAARRMGVLAIDVGT